MTALALVRPPPTFVFDTLAVESLSPESQQVWACYIFAMSTIKRQWLTYGFTSMGWQQVWLFLVLCFE